MQKLLVAKSISKSFGSGDNRVEVLKEVDLEVASGEMIAIMGPSGCGKTTLLNSLSGLDSISSGSILINGVDIAQLKERERDRLRAEQMGFVFQSYNLIPVLTAIENVELPLLSQEVSYTKARELASEALTKVGLLERRDHYPSQLSGGQVQRVALARALVHKPKMVWADEPTGALDRETGEMILDLFDHLHRTEKMTFFIVTHDPKVAERADRIIYLDSGRIVQERIPQENQNRSLIGGGQK